MNSQQDKALREQVIHAMRGDESHIDFEAAIEDLSVETAGMKIEGAPHTIWQLLEHMRIAQHDILEFSRNPHHKSPKWPEGYWPESETAENQEALDASIATFQKEAQAMEALISDPKRDLFKAIEGGTGQTLLREALVAAAHNSYHLGQLVYLKKALSGE